MEDTFYAMLKVAETLRVAYARVVERKGSFVMAESELPASKEKTKAALLLCAHVATLNGQLGEKMVNAVKSCYSSLADFVADEDRAKAGRANGEAISRNPCGKKPGQPPLAPLA
jgi:hypothetical protein